MSQDRLDQLSMDLLGRRYEDLNDVQKRVIDLILAEQPSDPRALLDEGTFWTRLADKVAAIGGSWSFIGGFTLALLLWIGLNLALKPMHLAFDPYPFIFLNLLLSTVAAIQAPVIMMSQNRQAAKDRLTAEHDYAVNLRAELEIMRVIDKLDALRSDELMVLCREHAARLSVLQEEVAILRAERGG
ncbi:MULTISPECIES: DUF1003 domain-containing protein [unclassified Caulobacter]|jgi:uncharacterized membrane protein|uniref:DUF1003 domain-containing protein n=1 Tax=unclassified Caulobacter TaxID=2648921 RepID=UPI0007821C7D|nr:MULTISPECIES: DUF1003 domain-containing protein [unclassified Caulobacter]AZS20349.1 DUF1003 domain-containing protein [Caulobacter sp. FWC26]